MREEDTPTASRTDVQLPHTTNDTNMNWIPPLSKRPQELVVCKNKELIIIDQACIMAATKNKWV